MVLPLETFRAGRSPAQQHKQNMQAQTAEALIKWLESNNYRIDKDYFAGSIWWRVYRPDPGGHYMEDRIKVVGQAPTLTEALKKAGFDIKPNASGPSAGAKE